MGKSRTQERGSRVLMIAASLVLVVAGLRAVKTIALPLLVAIFLSILSAPLLNWLCQRRIPKVIAVVTTVLANVSVMALFLLLIGGSINAFSQSVPRYQQRIEVEAEKVLDWLEKQDIDTSEYSWLRQETLPPEELLPEELLNAISDDRVPDEPAATPPAARGDPILGLINPGVVLDVIGTTLSGIASILSMTLLVFLLMVFILFEAGGLPARLEAAFGWRDEDLTRFTRQIQRYLAIKTAICLVTGILVGLGVWLLGVQYPLLWALIAFVLNYIPSIGSILAAVPPVTLTLIDLGPGSALLVALLFLAVNVLLGNFVEPHLMGRRFGISTLVVILSLIFWGWLWGPVGMLLSVPLTIIVKIMLENTEDFRWVAQLIGAGRRSPPLGAGLRMDEANPTLAGPSKG